VIFVDTSALLALGDTADPGHAHAAHTLPRLLDARERLLTTSYVELEACALVQRRLGMDAVRDLYAHLDVCDIHRIDAGEHASALAMLFDQDRRKLSLVDCASITFMRRRNITHAFAFDKHFTGFGFTLV
jgi:predicted nucleic acid-binding protein